MHYQRNLRITFKKNYNLQLFSLSDEDLPERPNQQTDRSDVHLAGNLFGLAPAAHRRVPSLDAEGEELRRKDEQNVSRRHVRIRSVVQFRVPEVLVAGPSVV